MYKVTFRILNVQKNVNFCYGVFFFLAFFFCLPIFSIVVLFGYVVILLFVSLIALKFEIKYHTTTCNIRKLVFVYRGKFEL